MANVVRVPAPWSVVATPAGFKVVDADGRALAYVYGEARSGLIGTGFSEKLDLDTARRIANGIARLPELLAKDRSSPADLPAPR